MSWEFAIQAISDDFPAISDDFPVCTKQIKGWSPKIEGKAWSLMVIGSHFICFTYRQGLYNQYYQFSDALYGIVLYGMLISAETHFYKLSCNLYWTCFLKFDKFDILGSSTGAPLTAVYLATWRHVLFITAQHSRFSSKYNFLPEMTKKIIFGHFGPFFCLSHPPQQR